MAVLQIQLQGFRELADRLRAISPEVARNGLRSSAYAGANVMRNAVKANAPVRTGALRDSIAVFRRRTPPEQALYSVGIRNVASRYANTALNRRLRRVGRRFYQQGPTYYGRFVEFGTSKMSAKPFMRPAFDSTAEATLNAMRDGLQRAVDRAARKYGGA